MSTWDIYDSLIDGIPEDILVTDARICNYWSVVNTETSCGMGVRYESETRAPMYAKDWIGAPLKELASTIKSWNYNEASLGHAAINCYYNSPALAREHGIEFGNSRHAEDRKHDPFIMGQRKVRGKRVVVIEHFPHLETFFEPVCDLSIICKEPLENGDYPIEAAEYLLPGADFVYITCASLADKTLPRLLELSKGAEITMVGPATPLAPQLFDFGISDLSGFVIQDAIRATKVLSGSMTGTIYSCGHKVSYKK